MEIKKMILDLPMGLTEEFYVPDFACGRIIGRNGSNIKEMTMITNCKINLRDRINQTTLNNPKVTDLVSIDDSSDVKKKVISLTGSFEQICHAKVLNKELKINFPIKIIFFK